MSVPGKKPRVLVNTILIIIGILGLLGTIDYFYITDYRNRMSEGAFQQMHKKRYEEIQRIFVLSGRQLLGGENLHETRFPSPEYRAQLKPLENLARTLNSMRKDLRSLYSEDVLKEMESAEYCYGMARFLLYSTMLDPGESTWDEYSEDIMAWVGRHRRKVEEAGPSNKYMKYSFFLQGFIERYLATQSGLKGLKDEYDSHSRFAKDAYQKAYDLSKSMSGESWLSPILNIEAIYTMDYCVHPTDSVLDALGSFLRKISVNLFKSPEAFDTLSRAASRNVAHQINFLEYLIVADSTRLAGQIQRQLVTWVEKNQEWIESEPSDSYWWTFVKCVATLKVLNDILTRHKELVKDMAFLSDREYKSILLEADSIVSAYGLADHEYCREVVGLYKSLISLKYYKDNNLSEKRLNLIKKLRDTVVSRRDTWSFALWEQYPQLMLIQFSNIITRD